jgi:hypothetical protein
MSDNTDRSAASRTASEAALVPRSTIFSAAHFARLDIRPTARSMARRRLDSTASRTLRSWDHLWAVRLGTPFFLAQHVTVSPFAMATMSWLFGLKGTFSGHEFSSDVRDQHTIAICHRASVWPHSRFSASGRRLAGMPSRGRKMWERRAALPTNADPEPQKPCAEPTFEWGVYGHGSKPGNTNDCILHAAARDTNPKRKRGRQTIASFRLRVSM